MGRLSQGNPALDGLSASIYSSYVALARASGAPYCPLHEGDTYLVPPVGARLFDGPTYEVPGIHKYSPIRGRPELIEAILEQRKEKDVQTLLPSQILITAGATSGISSAIRTLLAPGQSMIALAPFWPLIRGITTSHGVTFREIPFYNIKHDRCSLKEALHSVAEGDTAAIYVNWPNSPTGHISSPELVEVIAEFSCDRDLWVLSDEVYEDYVYGDGPLPRISAFPGMQERTLRFFSFSKAYAMAGNRVGYISGPAIVIDAVERYTTFAVYSVNGGGQVAAERAIRDGAAWQEEARAGYRWTGEQAARILDIGLPMSGAFLFLDAADSLDDRGMNGLLEDLAGQGVLVTPGSSFGNDYSTWIRICFTCLPPDEVLRGMHIIARRLGKVQREQPAGNPL